MADPWDGSWSSSWGSSWGEAAVTGSDTWGGNWGTSWGLTWTRATVTPVPSPRPPAIGGFYPARKRERRFSRQIWEEMLEAVERERQAALERAQAFPSTKDRRQAKKAARAASEAITAALKAADEAAEVAHAGAITRQLEGAAQAKSVAEYIKAMEAARAEAEAMEDEDEVETMLMLS